MTIPHEVSPNINSQATPDLTPDLNSLPSPDLDAVAASNDLRERMQKLSAARLEASLPTALSLAHKALDLVSPVMNGETEYTQRDLFSLIEAQDIAAKSRSKRVRKVAAQIATRLTEYDFSNQPPYVQRAMRELDLDQPEVSIKDALHQLIIESGEAEDEEMANRRT